MVEKRFKIEGDYVITSGLDWGYSNGNRLRIIKKSDNLILARVKGQGSRYSLGSFGYDSPRYTFLPIKGDMISIDLDEDIEYSREDMKEAKIKALKRFDEIVQIANKKGGEDGK